MRTWIVDTGPLIALLVGDDTRHEWAAEQSKTAPSSVVTCEAVVSETLFLLKREGYPADDVFTLMDVGFLKIDFDFSREHSHVRALMHRYRTRPMSFADACLVRMSELRRDDTPIWTLDRDFHFYRKHRGQSLSLVAPW